MDTVSAELLTDGGNGAVVRLPGRQFPGVLLQGDTLSILRADVADLAAAAARPEPDRDELREGLRLLLADLDGLVDRYEAALAAHGIPLPYARE